MRLNFTRLLGFSSLVLFALCLSGCSTFESRAKKKADVFASLDATTQSRLKAGSIELGDTQDMVYIALGNPEEKREKVVATGRTATWIYSTTWQEYQGTRLVGFRRDVVYNPNTKSYVSTVIPDYQPIYASRVEDRLRITFKDGRVTVVEQAEPARSASSTDPKN